MQISFYNNDDMNDLTEKVWAWFDSKGLHDVPMQMVKVMEESGELASEIARGNYKSQATKDAIGDTLVTVIGVAHHLGLSPAECLSIAYNEIKDRKGRVIDGSFVKDGQ